MSDIDTNLNNTEEISATKNVRLKCDTEGEKYTIFETEFTIQHFQKDCKRKICIKYV